TTSCATASASTGWRIPNRLRLQLALRRCARHPCGTKEQGSTPGRTHRPGRACGGGGSGMRRQLYLAAGLASVALGAVGAVLPVLPTVPFLILAAFCFARSKPEWEAR